MRKNTRKIFVFFLALCITCASISFPVYAGNGANKSVDSSAYIVVNGKTLYAFDYYNGTVTNTIDPGKRHQQYPAVIRLGIWIRRKLLFKRQWFFNGK